MRGRLSISATSLGADPDNVSSSTTVPNIDDDDDDDGIDDDDDDDDGFASLILILSISIDDGAAISSIDYYDDYGNDTAYDGDVDDTSDSDSSITLPQSVNLEEVLLLHK